MATMISLLGTATKRVALLGRIGLLAAVTLAAVLAYMLVVEPVFHHWGATATEAALALPGDELTGTGGQQATHAVTINVPPEQVWPWLVQMGQGRAGLYSYEWLENAIGCAMSNADRIHPEWQNVAVGDPVRAVPARYLGLVDVPPFWKVALVEQNHALVVPGLGSFILEPVGGRATRLIVRGLGPEGANPFGALTFIMGRRTMLGIKERAEGQIVPAWQDGLEVLIWAVAFLVSGLAGSGVLRREASRLVPALAVLLGALAVLFCVMFWRPPLVVSLLLDAGLISAWLWSGRGSAVSSPFARFRPAGTAAG